jgi:hypothetical protein
MYNVPSVYNKHDCRIPVPRAEVQAYRNECLFRDVCPFDDDILELCNLLMAENNWTAQTSLLSCAELYLNLRQHIRSNLP